MTSVTVSKLSMPPKRYRIDLLNPPVDGDKKAKKSFETQQQAATWDKRRGLSLRRYSLALKLMGIKGLYSDSKAYRLGQRITARANVGPKGSKPTRSLACSTDMRRWRIRYTGWAWKLFEETAGMNPTVITVAARKWEIPVSKLKKVNPRKLIAGFLSDVNRAGGVGVSGYLHGWLHGEYNDLTSSYDLHLHLTCAGELVSIVDSLRNKPKYRTTRGERPSVRKRVMAITNIPQTLSYNIKSYWPGMAYEPDANGKLVRKAKHGPVPPPYDSEYLLWLDRWSLEDIFVSKNLEVKAGGKGFRVRKTYAGKSQGKSKDGLRGSPECSGEVV